MSKMRMALAVAVTALAGGTLAAPAAAAPSGPGDGLVSVPPSGLEVATDEAKYLVVLASGKKKAEVQKKCAPFDEARLIASSAYPNFRPGFFVCVVGPFSRGLADEVLADYQQDVPDAHLTADR